MSAVLELSPSSTEPSEMVIPAVPGEFYGYSSEFTEARPLYVFLKCKAQKSRPLASAADLGLECNLVFLFSNPPTVRSIRAAQASGLLDESANVNSFGDTWVAAAEITAEAFYDIRSRKDTSALVNECRRACSKRATSIELQRDVVYAAMSDAGKYCLFLVNKSTVSSLRVDACHILL